jgi:hypothetical protein
VCHKHLDVSDERSFFAPTNFCAFYSRTSGVNVIYVYKAMQISDIQMVKMITGTEFYNESHYADFRLSNLC